MIRSLKLSASLLFTLAVVTTLVIYGSSHYRHDAPIYRESTLKELSRRARPAWDEMIALIRMSTPDPRTRVPKGDPVPALETLLASPVVKRAFHISPDLRMTILHRSATRRDAIEHVDLKTWKPRFLNLGFDVQFQQNSGNGTWWKQHGRKLAAARNREAFIVPIVQDNPTYWEARDVFRPVYLFGKGGGGPVLYVTGSEAEGFLGYEMNAWMLTDKGKVFLDRLGLGKYLDWRFDNQPYDSSNSLVGLSFLPEDLVSLRIAYSDVDYHPIMVEEVWRSWLILAGLIALTVLGTSSTVRQVRSLLDERELALAQSNFVSAVSHEMRTPLTTIKMYAEMLDQGFVTEHEKRSNYLRTIGQECDRLTRLIENVLDYSKISRRRREYRFEPVSVQAIADEAQACMRAPFEAAGLSLEVEVPDVTIAADRDALVQALVNLLSNALKYGKDGRRVRLFAEDGAHAVTLGVQDWGAGIPASEQKRVFEAFYRVGSELTRTAPGSGLGLALVEAHTRAHGGKVQLESDPGQGSTFRITLPKTRRTA